MAFTDILSGAAQNLTGNIDTAVQVVDDYRDMCSQVEQGAQNAGLGLLDSIQEAASAMDAVRSAASQALSGGASSVNVPQFKKPKYFKVQFNSSELQIDAAAPFEQKLDAQTGDQSRASVMDAAVRPSVTLSVNLYFDQFNKADAFRSTVLNPNLNAADLATNVATGISKLTGKTWSVQPQVEALLGAIYNNYTRYITFCWTDFSFTGYLSNVGAQYTMFSTSGKPIRAVVALRIQQEMDPVNIQSWSGDLNKAFSSTGISSVASSLGNILNVKL